MTVPLVPATVKTWLGLTGTADDQIIGWCLDATLAGVGALPVVADDPAADPADPASWPDPVALGTVMLTARRYRRRNSAGGIESFADSVLYVAKYDPEIASLLKLSDQKRPATDGPRLLPVPGPTAA